MDDIAGVLVALADRNIKSETYNVVDDDPAPRGAVSAFADELIGPAPAKGAAKPSRGTGSKRCRNEKLRAVYDLLAPSYKEGLLRIKDADPAIAAAARRQERIAAAQRDLQAVALAEQRADVESGVSTLYLSLGTLLRPFRMALAVTLTPVYGRFVARIRSRLPFSESRPKLNRTLAVVVVSLLVNVAGTFGLIAFGAWLAGLATGVPAFPPGWKLGRFGPGA